MINIESYCLQLAEEGKLWFEGEQLFRTGDNGQSYAKSKGWTKGRGRYQFKIGGRVKTVYANRLVWMLGNMKAIPEGCVVDHINGRRWDDCLSNLRLQSKKESDRQGSGCRDNTVLEKLSRWFEFMGEYNREPKHPHEFTWLEEGF